MRLPRPTDPDADWCDWVVVHRVMTRRPVGRALEWAELVAVRDRLAARGRLGDLGAVTGLSVVPAERRGGRGYGGPST
ncbi:MAG: hypothetical protein ACRD0V_07240 [Acidimicrobiales bacterium]